MCAVLQNISSWSCHCNTQHDHAHAACSITLHTRLTVLAPHLHMNAVPGSTPQKVQQRNAGKMCVSRGVAHESAYLTQNFLILWPKPLWRCHGRPFLYFFLLGRFKATPVFLLLLDSPLVSIGFQKAWGLMPVTSLIRPFRAFTCDVNQFMLQGRCLLGL